MTKRQKYFIKQKLIGVLMLILAVLTAQLTNDGTVALILIPLSFVLIFSKRMLLLNDYYTNAMDKKGR